MNRYEIAYCTDGNRNVRRKVMKGKTELEARERFFRMMKTMNVYECQFEIFSIEEL